MVCVFFLIFVLSFHLQFYSSFHINVLFLLIQVRDERSISSDGWHTSHLHNESCQDDFEIQNGTRIPGPSQDALST